MSWFARMKQFLADVVSELKKTTWPSRKEVYGTTLVVIVTVIVCAAYLWGVDMVLNTAVDFIFVRFGG